MRIKLNDSYANLKDSYLFSEIRTRVNKYKAENPDKKVISLGIGDVTLPLAPAVVDAMKKASLEMGSRETFRGYPPEYGYDFLRSAIKKHYEKKGICIGEDEIFVSDGAKSDCGNFGDILGDNDVYIPDPVYPVYLDSNIMNGRNVHFISGNEGNSFLPTPDFMDGGSAVIYICSPGNPTGAVYERQGLRAWVDYANRSGSLIIFDAAYEAFISGDYPRSIFEIEGAETCAVEICSFSKTAGFTGTRCAWTVVPMELEAGGILLNKMWKRRQATKFNGVSYIVQRGAEASLSDEGMAQCMSNVKYYMDNARLIADLLNRKGIWYTGAVSSPYIWLKCPDNLDSWAFFDRLLHEASVVGTPGAGFGSGGEGYFRLTSFASREDTLEAVDRIDKLL